jgi:hypothetical protein
MTEKKLTLGQAIDQIIDALNPLSPEARLTAVEAACSHLDVKTGSVHTSSLTADPSMSTQTPAHLATRSVAGASPPATDIRTLRNQKQPKSARQMACVVAYYLRELAPETDRSEIVTVKDLEKYFKQAHFKLPKTIGQVLPDAKSAGYFETAPGKGAYALNAVGYNLVAHNLPAHKGE